MTARRSIPLSLIFSALVMSAALLSAASRRPVRSNMESGSETLAWVKDGVSTTIESRIIGYDYYLSIEDVARLASAQLRWQSISEQACLSRTTGLVCFNWGRNQIYLNGEKTLENIPLKFYQGQLYVPLYFIPTKDFEKFSTQEFYWNAQAKRITEEEPVTITMPPVENLGDRYQLALDVKKGIPYHLIEKNSERIWLRFTKGRTEGSQILEGDHVIRRIEIHQKRKSADLIVFLGSKSISSEVYFDQATQKLTVDVFYEGTVPVPTEEPVAVKPDESLEMEPAPDPVEKPAASLKVSPSPIRAVKKPVLALPMARPTPRVMPAPAANAKTWTVVVDAGHGGIDAGAIGVRGSFEKDVNLRVAKQLVKALQKHKNVRAILTRDRDEFLSLTERTEIANKAKADMFVSVHCNSSLSAQSQGFEVYILSPDATDQAAEAVARIENSVVALETKKGESSSKLSSLLASMAVYTFINESSKAAALICRGVKKRTTADKTAVKEANFHVLRGAQMPGVLVELGYLSHPISEIKLRSSRYTDSLASGVADGIMEYRQSLNGRKRASYRPPVKTVSRAAR